MEEQKTKKSTPGWIWILIVAIIIVTGLAIWFATKGEESETTAETVTASATVSAYAAPEGWQQFTSSKGFSLYYPAEYKVVENSSKNITIYKSEVPVMDMYPTTVAEAASDIAASVNLYTDDTKGYMTNGLDFPVTVAGLEGKKVSGTFGKNAGAQVTIHDGIDGTYVVFVNEDKVWNIHSYDAGDATAQKNFTDILASISF